MSNFRRARHAAAALGVLFALAGASAQGAILPRVPVAADCLPPSAPSGGYVAEGPINFLTILGTLAVISLDDFAFNQCFAPPASGSAVEVLTSTLTFGVTVGGGSAQATTVTNVPVSITVTYGGTVGNVTTYTEQMTQFGVSVPGAEMIRIDPVHPSTGTAEVTDYGGGNFAIGSFFDIFTDLSLDGGATWLPSLTSQRIVFQAAEPAPLGIIGLSLFCLGTALYLRPRPRR